MDDEEKWLILIVDDEEVIHENLEYTLRRMVYANRGIECIHAYSAAEAKRKLSEHSKIAIIILDVMMETDDAGLYFVKYLRNEVKNKETRVLIYTGQPGIAPKRKVADKYIIDGYLDKNSSDNDDCYVAVRLALKSYAEIHQLMASSKKEDIRLFHEIAAIYNGLLAEPNNPKEYEEAMENVNTMLHLAQEILASYALEDLKNGVKIGTTKSGRLSPKEYSALVSIHHIKVILNETTPQTYEREKGIIFKMMVKEAQRFSSIQILSDATRKSLQNCIANCNTL